MRSPSGIDIDGIPEIVLVRPPVASRVFETRADRFRSLASGSTLEDYLGAMANLAEAQHVALAGVPAVPDESPLQGTFPLRPGEWRRAGSWRQALAAIIHKMKTVPLPSPARAALERLYSSASAEIETSADALLAGKYTELDLSCATFLGAALQVYWTAFAGTIKARKEAGPGHSCPICASPPMAGIVTGNDKLRYLVCGLCSTEWYLPRLTCANCGSTEGISYLSIEGDTSGAKAECCARCRTYLKLFYLESVPSAEPFADDAATLALDSLLSEEGFFRTGPNFYMLPGSGSSGD